MEKLKTMSSNSSQHSILCLKKKNSFLFYGRSVGTLPFRKI